MQIWGCRWNSILSACFVKHHVFMWLLVCRRYNCKLKYLLLHNFSSKSGQNFLKFTVKLLNWTEWHLVAGYVRQRLVVRLAWIAVHLSLLFPHWGPDGLLVWEKISLLRFSLKAGHERKPIFYYGSECRPNTEHNNNEGGGGQEHWWVFILLLLTPLFSVSGRAYLQFNVLNSCVLISNSWPQHSVRVQTKTEVMFRSFLTWCTVGLQ